MRIKWLHLSLVDEKAWNRNVVRIAVACECSSCDAEVNAFTEWFLLEDEPTVANVRNKFESLVRNFAFQIEKANEGEWRTERGFYMRPITRRVDTGKEAWRCGSCDGIQKMTHDERMALNSRIAMIVTEEWIQNQIKKK